MVSTVRKFLLILGLSAASTFVHAGAAHAVTDAPPIPVAVTLSGGVSLGAYQAGQLYYSSLVMRANPRLFEVKLLTGASAGALNALFTLFSVCGDETLKPSASAFYRAWVGFRGEDLLAPEGERRALFSRRAFEGIASELEVRWQQGLPESCDTVLGLSVTRLRPLEDASKIGFARQGEKIILRIRGRGAGRPPLVTNYVNPMLFPKPLLLDLTPGDDRQNFAALRDVLFASSAFPVAFPPQELRTCVASPSFAHADLPFHCPAEEATSQPFIDGGILDNKPLALAEKIARTGLIGDGTSWREIPIAAVGPGAAGLTVPVFDGANLLYLYSDLSATTYPRSESSNDDMAFTIAPMLIGSVFNSARNQDSTSLLEQSPRLEEQIAAFKNGVPRMGDPLLGFFGFFERDFRAFDFYLGLWEAREYYRTTLRNQLRRGGESIGTAMTLPEFASEGVAESADAARLRCLDETLLATRDIDGTGACANVPDRGFVTLTRLARERLRARRTDVRFMTAYLAREHYEYRDLGLSRSDAWRAPAKMKTESIKAVSKLASAQDLSEAMVIRSFAPVALNLIEPLPIEQDLAVTVGPQVSVVTSRLIANGESVRLRWYLGAGLENVRAWLGPDGGRAIVTPATGFEFEPNSMQTRFLQTRFSLGGGYKFRENDPGGVVEIGTSLTLIERLRFQLKSEVMPFATGDSSRSWQFLPSIGLQFYF